MVTFKDLTLREGSQVPGLNITETAGTTVLDRLAELGIGTVEISFPRAHAREPWYRHADDLGLRTAALARAIPGDIDAALAVNPDEIEVIINTSDRQLEYALKKSRQEAKALLVENIERTLDGGVDTGVTLMDAIRANNDFLVEIARAAIDTGANHITLADTTGAGTTEQVAETVDSVASELDNDAGIAIHTHDDMGIATANAAAGIAAGATSIDATIGGIGERAGNAPFEEVAVLLAESSNDLAIKLDELVPSCRDIHDTLGIDVSPGKPVLGERAYRHESGMHTAAMLREPSTYEPFNPETYGVHRELLFGGDTGRGAVRALLDDTGREPTDHAITDALHAIRAAAAEQGEPLDESTARHVITMD